MPQQMEMKIIHILPGRDTQDDPNLQICMVLWCEVMGVLWELCVHRILVARNSGKAEIIENEKAGKKIVISVLKGMLTEKTRMQS